VQAGARAVWRRDLFGAEAALRYRDAANLPSTELVVRADGGIGPLSVAGELGRAAWRDADVASYSGVTVTVGPFLGATVFGELTNGDRGAPAWADPMAAVTVSNREGWRAGASLELGSRAMGSVAYISLEQD